MNPNAAYRAFLAAAQAIRGGESCCLAIRALPQELPAYTTLATVIAAANAMADDASGEWTPSPVHVEIETVPAGDGWGTPATDYIFLRYGGGCSYAELMVYPDSSTYWTVGCRKIIRTGPALAVELRRVAGSVERRCAAGEAAYGPADPGLASASVASSAALRAAI